MNNAMESTEGQIIISVQPPKKGPLDTPDVISRLALSAIQGGAAGIRVDTPANVRAVRAVSNLCIIGIHKVHSDRFGILITPGFDLARDLVEAGADLIALDATMRWCDEKTLKALVDRIHTELEVPVMADVRSADEGRIAWDLGADYVATTLSVLVRNRDAVPAIDMVKELAQSGIRCVLEGGVAFQDHVRRAYDAGAFSVVVGTMVTDPEAITRRLREGCGNRPAPDGTR